MQSEWATRAMTTAAPTGAELARRMIGRTLYTCPVNAAAPSATIEPPTLDQSDDEEQRSGRYQMNAYTGGVATVAMLGPTVFDLAGMEIPKQNIPALYEHDRERIIGVSDSVEKTEAGLIVAGYTFDDEPEAQRIKRMSARGMPWQASIGIDAFDMQFIDDGETLEANGRTFEGPIFYAARSRLLEASFVALGADSETTAIAAKRGEGQAPMTTEKPQPSAEDAVKAERQRVASILAAFPNDAAHASKHVEAGSTLIEAKADYADALAEQLERAKDEQVSAVEAAKAEALKAARPAQPPIPSGSSDPNGDPIADWNAIIQRNIAAGMPRAQAVSAAAAQNPDLRRAMLVATNGGLGPSSFGLQG